MYTQAKAVQRLHRKYLHEEISIEKAYEIFMTLWAQDLVMKVREAVLKEDPIWIENISRFVKEMEENDKRERQDEDGQLFLPFDL
jgi:hypothetical protein